MTCGSGTLVPETSLCLNRLNVLELLRMKQHHCISIFKPKFLTSILEMKQKHLSGKLLHVVRHDPLLAGSVYPDLQ